MTKTPPKFVIEQIALNPKNPTLARKILTDLGLSNWVVDNVHAKGEVFGVPGENHALLQFNYEGNVDQNSDLLNKPLELEILHYTNGRNWIQDRPNVVSHLGMHVTEEEFVKFKDYFFDNGISVAQSVETQGHTNKNISESRRYNYVIFSTFDLIGVDLKFIIRKDYVPVAAQQAVSECNHLKKENHCILEEIENHVDAISAAVDEIEKLKRQLKRAKSKTAKSKTAN